MALIMNMEGCVHFAKLTISARLYFGFACLGLLFVGVGGFSVWKMRGIEGEVRLLIDDRYQKVVKVHEIKDAVNDASRSIRNLFIMSNPQDLKKQKAEILEKDAVIDGAILVLKSSIQSERGRQDLSKVVQWQRSYRELRGKMQSMLDAGDVDGAKQALLNQVRPAQINFMSSLDDLIKYQNELMVHASTDLADEVTQSSVFIGMAILMSVVVGVLLVSWVVRTTSLPLRQAVAVAEAVAEGNLTVQFKPVSSDETGALLVALNTMKNRISDVVKEVRDRSESVAIASSEIAQGNLDLSARTELQASSLQQTAVSMGDLSETVRQNAANAQLANQLAHGASSVAQKGGLAVNQVVVTMQGINESAKRIADITGVIDGIAFQTNILALNAAVEAARAGEHGRGFAVVASEVRMLAQKSATAAKEIKTLINDSVERVGQGGEIADQAGLTMSEVVDAIKKVTDLVAEISRASVDQSASVAQIEAVVSRMDQSTQQNAALVEESAAAAESLKNQAEQLVKIVSVFTIA